MFVFTVCAKERSGKPARVDDEAFLVAFSISYFLAIDPIPKSYFAFVSILLARKRIDRITINNFFVKKLFISRIYLFSQTKKCYLTICGNGFYIFNYLVSDSKMKML